MSRTVLIRPQNVEEIQLRKYGEKKWTIHVRTAQKWSHHERDFVSVRMAVEELDEIVCIDGGIALPVRDAEL
jgi:hypothetical protein